jgi:hypothetical protein
MLLKPSRNYITETISTPFLLIILTALRVGFHLLRSRQGIDLLFLQGFAAYFRAAIIFSLFS